MPSVDTASAILASLEALGLTHVLYCPGSRSAPFAYALEAGAFGGDARAVLDERGAGFMAVGLARTGALPAVVVTSGTDVAELATPGHAAAPPPQPRPKGNFFTYPATSDISTTLFFGIVKGTLVHLSALITHVM